PTCGSAGIVPACLYYMYNDCNTSEKDVINAVLTAGVIGNVVKTNASISGAECGCQAEVGVACSMAAAAIADIYDLDIEKIGCSAEIALEHNLGLTCDPVLGLVQIPCIERNASAATDAFNATVLARSLADKRKISFDDIVAVMYETGKDMATNYRETAQGGLAKIYKVTK
ncbi:MAG: L-serine ammonia-lyase, iron-sulfur-dependent, subunit alpha, partial [Clostridia bacterium]|nr:L-serine ammonia-lyase, iron-sulfur-dependent, subunit alpha [Clostridia bacterium]